MPTSPPIACPCGGKRKNGVCDRCGPTNRQAYRRSANERGYGSDWRKLRRWVLAHRPLCEDCLAQGHTTAATDLHHVQKLRDAPDMRLDPDNLMPLCSRCHGARTAKGE